MGEKDQTGRVVEYVRGAGEEDLPRSLEQAYVEAGNTPRIRQAEDSWISSLALVLVALVATAIFLDAIGYQW